MIASKAVRSLHVIDVLELGFGGSAHAALGTANFLAMAGHPATVVGCVGEGVGVLPVLEAYPAIEAIGFAKSFPARFSNSSAFINWLEEHVGEFDVVEIHAVFSFITLRAAGVCRRHGVPYLIRPHGSLDPFDLQKHAWAKRLLGKVLIKPLLEGAQGVVLTAPRESDCLQTYGATVSRHIIALQIPVDSRTGDRIAFRAAHGIPDDALVVLFLSRIDYKKGLNLLLPALASLKSDFSKLWFVLAGSGEPEYVAKVKSWLAEYGMHGWTSVIGFAGGQAKSDAFAGADVFALPSMNENFGIVNVEALRAGLPVVISNQVYICDGIQAAGAGLVCNYDVESLRTMLRQLLSDPPMRTAIGGKAKEYATNEFDPTRVTEKVVALYHTLLAQTDPLLPPINS